jgi:hypothetical protein
VGGQTSIFSLFVAVTLIGCGWRGCKWVQEKEAVFGYACENDRQNGRRRIRDFFCLPARGRLSSVSTVQVRAVCVCPSSVGYLAMSAPIKLWCGSVIEDDHFRYDQLGMHSSFSNMQAHRHMTHGRYRAHLPSSLCSFSLLLLLLVIQYGYGL